MRLGAFARIFGLSLAAIALAVGGVGAADDAPPGSGPSSGERGQPSGHRGHSPSGVPDLPSNFGAGPAPNAPQRGRDHQRVLDGVKQGRYLSLKTLLDKVGLKRRGTIISVELPETDDVAVYIVKLRDPQGRILTFRFDAASGALIDTVER